MNTHWVIGIRRYIFTGVLIINLLAALPGRILVAKAESTLDPSQVNAPDQKLPGTYLDGANIPSNLSSALPVSDYCGGPIIYLSGVTTSRYSNNTVANSTTFDRTGWYSDAVGNGETTAFSVGNGEPPPYDVCVFRGVIHGHIPLDWSWEQAHDFGGGGDRTYTGHLALIDGARVHNVEDGWKPRELPEFGNTGIMYMRNTYMTGIRDDAIENDNFMPGIVEDSLFDGVRTFLSEQNQSGGVPTTLGSNEDQYIRITRTYVRLYPTNINGTENPGRWFKWLPEGAVNHKLIITDSVFAVNMIPKGGWSALDFPAGTTFMGTNYILWLGTPGTYEATVPPGLIFLEGQVAINKWNEVRNNWLAAHGYSPRPLNDFNPMDDPVVAPARPRQARSDFDGDGDTDIAVFRPSTGIWYVKDQFSTQYGGNGDIPVVADYNGDGKAEIAVFRPSNSTWYIQGVGAFVYGQLGDIPVVADYNGDAKAEIAVFRPSNSTWYIQGVGAFVYGQSGDIPVVADYNGDGKADIAVFRPSNSTWYLYGIGPRVYGTVGDIPVVADYNGDGKADIAVFRPSNSTWYLYGIGPRVYGTVGDIPAIGDYNGDGKADIAVFRPSNSTWYLYGIGSQVHGTAGDIPV